MTQDTSARAYYAKILLFGEYTVIFNSNALTIPFGHFSGEISFLNRNRYTDYDFAVQSNKDLVEFGKFLRNLDKKGELRFQFDFEQFDKDLKNGMFFESNIPMGYGLGSSGSLVAAMYERYAANRIPSETSLAEHKLLQLKLVFEQMESWFHGRSSGLDPLNCYFRVPMLLEGKEKIRFIDVPKSPIGKNGAIFLINTERSSKTQPLVELFMKKVEDRQFDRLLKERLIPLTNQCILSILEAKSDSFFGYLQQLSMIQSQHFRPMIPDEFMEVWNHGLQTENYYLKLCGSGGGGFLLGFTKDFELIQDILKKFDISPLRVYTEES